MDNKLTKELMHSMVEENFLSHHGILGMHWGIRRFQKYPKGYSGDGKFIGREERKQNNKKAKELYKKIAQTKNVLYFSKGAADSFEKKMPKFKSTEDKKKAAFLKSELQRSVKDAESEIRKSYKQLESIPISKARRKLFNVLYGNPDPDKNGKFSGTAFYKIQQREQGEKIARALMSNKKIGKLLSESGMMGTATMPSMISEYAKKEARKQARKQMDWQIQQEADWQMQQAMHLHMQRQMQHQIEMHNQQRINTINHIHMNMHTMAMNTHLYSIGIM